MTHYIIVQIAGHIARTAQLRLGGILTIIPIIFVALPKPKNV